MKKYLLSALLLAGLCVHAAAADFGTLTISSDREVIDDSVLYELAEADEPSTLTLRTPNGETGSLMFDGTEYHLQPCGQTDEFTYRFCFPRTAKTPMVSPTPNGLWPIPTLGSTFLIR